MNARSVYVLKPGDPTPNHSDEATENEEVGAAVHGARVLPASHRQPSQLLDTTGATNTLKDRKPYLLSVFVYKAQHLQATYWFRGSLDPFVSVRFNSNTLQTKQMQGQSAPIWNRKLEFPFHMPLASDSIELQVPLRALRGRSSALTLCGG